MPSIKEFDTKLKSLKNTQKITKTMKMVAASKLRKAQENQQKSKAFAEHLSILVRRLAAAVGAEDHPLLTPRSDVKKVLLLVYTSDKGLCGGFNNNIIKHVRRWLAENASRYEHIALSFCGRRGYAHFRSRATVDSHYENITANPGFVNGHEVCQDAIEAFLAGQYDEVYMVYNHFISPLSQQPVMEKLLPIEAGEVVTGEAYDFSHDYIFEPGKQEILDDLLPRTASYKVYYALLENSAGEHGARMTAMDNATGNADKLIDEYTLRRNRARQAAITTELTEIVSGAEAL